MSLSFNLSKAHSPQHCLRIHHQLYAVISVIEEDCMIRISTTKWGKTIFLSFLTLNTWVISTDWFEFITLSLVPLSPLRLSQVRMLYLNLHRDFWWEEAEKLPQLETADSYSALKEMETWVYIWATLSLCFGKQSCGWSHILLPSPLSMLLFCFESPEAVLYRLGFGDGYPLWLVSANGRHWQENRG